jgi:hypothetical protein
VITLIFEKNANVFVNLNTNTCTIKTKNISIKKLHFTGQILTNIINVQVKNNSHKCLLLLARKLSRVRQQNPLVPGIIDLTLTLTLLTPDLDHDSRFKAVGLSMLLLGREDVCEGRFGHPHVGEVQRLLRELEQRVAPRQRLDARIQLLQQLGGHHQADGAVDQLQRDGHQVLVERVKPQQIQRLPVGGENRVSLYIIMIQTIVGCKIIFFIFMIQTILPPCTE